MYKLQSKDWQHSQRVYTLQMNYTVYYSSPKHTVCFLDILYTSLTFENSNLEHGLDTLTESLSQLKSELHNYLH